MEKDSFCFYGNGKPHGEFPQPIHENSLVAKLYRLQKAVDRETDRQIKESSLAIPCKAGCCECCSRCFGVSETEFIQILDDLIRNRRKEDLEELIEKSKQQWKLLKERYPEYADKISGAVSLYEILRLYKIALPFPCIFLSESGRCSIYPIRPLACRLHGVCSVNPLTDRKPCSKINELIPTGCVDLAGYEPEILSFLFYRYEGKTILRRPVPLFYYFCLIFKDKGTLNSICDSEIYKGLLKSDENEYIRHLMETDSEG